MSCQICSLNASASSPSVSTSVEWVARRIRSNFPLLRRISVAAVIFLRVLSLGVSRMRDTRF